MTTIRTTAVAQNPPVTGIEFDAPILSIRKGYKEELYEVTEHKPDMEGRAFRVTKDSTGEVYDVLISPVERDSQCDCIGFERHSRCKHVDAIRHLITAGKLGESPKSYAEMTFAEWALTSIPTPKA